MKDLQVSLFQALVLLMFNNRDNLPFEDIRSETGIGADTLFLQNFLVFLSAGSLF